MANSKKTKAEVVETEAQPEVTEAEVKPEAIEEVAVAEEPVAAEPVLEEVAEAVAEEAVAEDVAEEKPQSDKPSLGKRFLAGAKERFRKFLVSLKRNPQRIPLLFMAIVSFIWLIWLFTFSKTPARYDIDWAGLAVFMNTLLSVLLLALFFSAFPKRKKPNIVMIVLLFVFMAAMICMDVLYYKQVDYFIYNELDAAGRADVPFAEKSLNYSIAHIVLQGVSALILALYPVYKRLLLKINTKKEIAGNDIKETIDMEEE